MTNKKVFKKLTMICTRKIMIWFRRIDSRRKSSIVSYRNYKSGWTRKQRKWARLKRWSFIWTLKMNDWLTKSQIFKVRMLCWGVMVNISASSTKNWKEKWQLWWGKLRAVTICRGWPCKSLWLYYKWNRVRCSSCSNEIRNLRKCWRKKMMRFWNLCATMTGTRSVRTKGK